MAPKERTPGPEVVKESGEVRGVHPPVLFDRTQKILGRLEAELGEPMLTYWNSNKGSICQNDVAGLYGLLQRMGKVDRLSMFIKSDGGSGQASLRMGQSAAAICEASDGAGAVRVSECGDDAGAGRGPDFDGADCASVGGGYVADT